MMGNYIRSLVSGQKKRYRQDGFDLDLTYITPRIIAMGFPAHNFERFYRNPINKVALFLNNKHGSNYRIYHLLVHMLVLNSFNRCCERTINAQHFTGTVVEYPFEDHNAPQFRQILDLCEDVVTFLNQDPQNVVAINCKAGKGRTGAMVCAVLQRLRISPSGVETLDFYGTQRTKNGHGVTIPSQRRYVLYHAHWLQRGFSSSQLLPPAFYLAHLTCYNLNPSVKTQKVRLSGTVECFSQPLPIRFELSPVEADSNCSLLPKELLSISGDLRTTLYFKVGHGKRKKFCAFWLNTFFVANPSPDFKHAAFSRSRGEADSNSSNLLLLSHDRSLPAANHCDAPSTITSAIDTPIVRDGTDRSSVILHQRPNSHTHTVDLTRDELDNVSRANFVTTDFSVKATFFCDEPDCFLSPTKASLDP